MRRSLYWKIFVTFLTVVLLSLAAGGATFSFVMRQHRPTQHIDNLLVAARLGAADLERFIRDGHRPEELETHLDELFRDLPQVTVLVGTHDGQIHGKTELGREDLRSRLQSVIRTGLAPGEKFSSKSDSPRAHTFILPLGKDAELGYALISTHFPEDFHVAALQAMVAELGVILVVAASLGFLAFRALAGRLSEVQQCLAGVAMGDLTLRVASTGPDEIGDLGRCFNTMAERLEHVVNELETIDLRRRQFMADISHELKTPVTALRGHLERVMSTPAKSVDAGTKTSVSIAFEEVDRLKLLIEDLLELSRLDSTEFKLKLQEEILQRIARHAIERFTAAVANRSIQVVTHLSPEPVRRIVDGRRIEQVLANLIQNAIQSVPDGGRVEVTVEEQDGRAVLLVDDNGPGIPAQELAHVFDRFYSTSESGGGTGLGLSIVKRLVEAHGGSVHLESRETGGTRAVVEL